MKKILIASVLLTIVSCAKKVQCCTDTQTNYKDYPEMDYSSTICADFKGNKEEVRQYEQETTKTIDMVDYVISLKTECR